MSTEIKISEIKKVLKDGVLSHVYVQAVLSNGSHKAAYDKNLHPEAESNIKSAIEEWLPAIIKSFEESVTEEEERASPKGETIQRVDVATIILDEEKIRTEADKLKGNDEIKDSEK